MQDFFFEIAKIIVFFGKAEKEEKGETGEMPGRLYKKAVLRLCKHNKNERIYRDYLHFL